MTSSWTLLDGPLGSELEARGLALPAPLWSARALLEAPEVVAAVHAQWADVGAKVHTAATFRTTARACAKLPPPHTWESLLVRAVALAREGVARGRPDGARATIAGSMAPLCDCWHPELTPDAPSLAAEHGALARALANAGVELLFVETMPTLLELEAAVRAAVSTGLPVWAALTLGPRGAFFSRAQVLEGAARAADAGASAFGLTCSTPTAITPMVEALAHARQRPGVLLAQGNALFEGSESVTPQAYRDEARRWREAGVTLVGACCGTTVEHVRALAQDLPTLP